MQNPTGLLLCLNCVVVYEEEEVVVEGEAIVGKPSFTGTKIITRNFQQAVLGSTDNSS